jgi:hypothetical protein
MFDSSWRTVSTLLRFALCVTHDALTGTRLTVSSTGLTRRRFTTSAWIDDRLEKRWNLIDICER